MAAISPRPSLATHSSLSSDNNMRPNLMKRQSSQSSHASSTKHGPLSPGSLEQHHQPQRHHVKPAKKGRPGVVLPRNNHGGSGRNLVKLAQQAQQAQQHAAAAEEGRKRSREKSRESDQEIRLPGSLDEHHIRFAGGVGGGGGHLPRNTSHTKLKKNLSHGQLTRLGLEKAAVKGPPSPGLKARNKRPKSADMLQAAGGEEKDLHEQEVELAAQQQAEKKDLPKKVGFAVGSEASEDDEGLPQMEGSGLQGEDEWTDQSASASPYSTRQNTANNSRRASMTVADKGSDGREVKMPSNAEVVDHGKAKQPVQPTAPPPIPKVGILTDGSTAEESDDDDEDDEQSEEESENASAAVESISPGTVLAQTKKEPQQQPATPTQPIPSSSQQQQNQPQQHSLIHQSKEKEHANPAARRLLNRNAQPSPAPALVSNVSALDDARSARTNSPAPSMQSLSRQTSHVEQGEAGIHESGSGELVSRFMPSASHPGGSSVTQSVAGSGPSTTLNTPKNGSLHSPEDDRDGEATQEGRRDSETKTGFSIGPVSPSASHHHLLSTSAPRSVSSGGTSAVVHARPFRNEQRMMNEKAAAENEDAATFAPIIPGHVFDRRNESLKSYLNLRMLGGDGRGGLSATTGLPNDGTTSLLGASSSGIVGARLFEGRFKAVNTELKVVQRFRDPIAESVARLQADKATDMHRLRGGGGATKSSTGSSSMRGQQSTQNQAGKLSTKSKSAISLAPTSQPKQSSKLSTSASPPKHPEPTTTTAASVLTNSGSKSSSQINKRSGGRAKVSFSGTVNFDREAPVAVAAVDGDVGGDKGRAAADEIARRLWESVGS